MKHLITKEKNILHGTIGWSHKGKDGQYCEAGETVKIKWQPTAGWGLQELHYTDGDGNEVTIENGEFVMPDSAVTIGATFKRFFLSDWADNPYNPKPKPKYLTFTAGVGGASVGFIVDVSNVGSNELPETYTKPSLQYSTDGGKTWQDYDLQLSDDASDATLIELAEGAIVMFKGVNENLASYIESYENWVFARAYIDGSVAASGDVTSLLNGIGGDVAVPQYCYLSMFGNCAGLTTAPALPSTTLANNCYDNMFYGCTGLIEAPVLLATSLENGCYSSMFYGCENIQSYDVATLNISDDIFVDNNSCASLTIHAETPPEIAEYTIEGLPADCAIYVPAASVDAYKAAQYWSARAAYIQAIQ